MDDTAFFYSRTLRIITILAIVVPLVVIGGLFWYYASDDAPEALPLGEPSAAVEPAGNGAPSSPATPDDENPLRPVGPKASTRLIPGGSVVP